MVLQAHCAIMPCESQHVVTWATYATHEAACGAKSLVDGGCPSGRRSMTSVLLVVAVALNGLLMSRCRLPKVQARDDIIAQFVFVCIYNLSRVSISSLITMGDQCAYLSGGCVQPPNVLRCDNVYKRTALHVPYFDEARLKCKDVGVENGERLRCSFPCNSPVWPGSPPVPVDEEGIIRVAEEKLARQPFDVDWLDVLLAYNEVE